MRLTPIADNVNPNKKTLDKNFKGALTNEKNIK
jgi:hypothetical protein